MGFLLLLLLLLLIIVVVDVEEEEEVVGSGILIDVLVIARSVALLAVVVIVGRIDAISLNRSESFPVAARALPSFPVASVAAGGESNGPDPLLLLLRKDIKGRVVASVVAFDGV